MSRTSTTHFPPPSTHPSRYTNPHQLPPAPGAPLCIVTAAQLLVASRAAAAAARSVKDRARVAAAVGAQLDGLLARIEQAPEAVQYARAFELLDVGTDLRTAAAGVDAGLFGTLVELSDLLLDLCAPCRDDARPRRRRGIVRSGDGYPRVRPQSPSSARVYRLVDERDYLIAPCMEYEVLDWQGDPHSIVAPVGDRGDGRISRDVLRAFLVMGLANLYRKCERLKADDRSSRYAAWPYQTRMPGLIGAGEKDDIVVDVVELLRVHCFGPPPSAPDDEPPTGTAAPALPLLPTSRRASFDDADVEENGVLRITEISLPQMRTAEVWR
jgi:hypothetical protein